MNRVLVTGASGFVGRALCRTLVSSGVQVRAAVRRKGSAEALDGVDEVVVGDLGPSTDWRNALRAVDAVVHLAARVHVLRDTAADPLQAFRIPNVLGTAGLARACAQLGVHRLLYVSSIKVNGEGTLDRPFNEADPPAPEDAYGISKAESERVLREIAQESSLEVVVVRPCLIHGPGVGGNLRVLLRALARGLPLPFGAVWNQRSLLGLDNVCDLLRLCLDHPQAAGQTFLAADGQDLSTPELIRTLAAGLGRPARLVPVPLGALELVAKLTGQAPALRRLMGSLQVDIAKARSILGWSPPVPTELGLYRTGQWYRESACEPPATA